ncbi:MAG: T9SS type A sorting domain-containing protein [Bacteroidales bacterium]|nr:T9SS type A sorting domain-containing protein [Bacteroidales bacterium]
MKNNFTLKALLVLFSLSFGLLANAQSFIQKGDSIVGEAQYDEFGKAVAMNADGSVVAIGAPYNDGFGTNSGHVRIFEWNGSSWIQLGSDIDALNADDREGWNIDLSADGYSVIIGAIAADDNGSASGHVRVFTWNGTTWLQKGTNLAGDAAGDQLGYSVAISNDGNTIIAGAEYNSINGTSAGSAKIYYWNVSNWTQKGSTLYGAAAEDNFGESVNINADGSVIVIGAPKNNNGGTWAGETSVYYWNGADWTLKGSPIDGITYDWSGCDVDIDSTGNTIIIGAWGGNSGTGMAKIFEWNSTQWIQKGNNLTGLASSDNFGQSVSISANGNSILIGAPKANTYHGYASCYDWVGGAWSPKGQTLSGMNNNESFSLSTGMSNDGNTIICGAHGIENGYAKIFEFQTPQIISENNSGKLLVYPNPSSGSIYFPDFENISIIEFYNVNGEIIRKIQNPVSPITNISDFAPGTYLVKIRYQYQTSSTILIKQ